MLSYLLLVASLLGALYVLNFLWTWRRNYLAAKASGFPVIVVPFYVFNLAFILSHRYILGAFRKLPARWQPRWIELVGPNHAERRQFSDFATFPHETYITASPGGNMFTTANADIINQITTRRSDFPKPTWMYRNLNLFGANVVSTEGHVWRHQRKITTPPFNERNIRLVWAKTIEKAQLMLRSWMGDKGDASRTIDTVEEDTTRLTLHVISFAGFGMHIAWPGLEEETGAENQATDESRPGTSITPAEALATLVHNVFMVVILGAKGLGVFKWLPLPLVKRVHAAYHEWNRHTNEMMTSRRARIRADPADGGQDLLSALVRASIPARDSKPGAAPPLTDVDILGNAFIFILAGHETTANTIHFALVYLALHPAAQRRLQADLDAVLGGRPPDRWDYERDIPRLFGSMAGAVLNETLRVVPPVVGLPKWTYQPQPLTVPEGEGGGSGKKEGGGGPARQCLVPANTLLNLSVTGVHRNPKYFPHGPPADPARPVHPTSNVANDLEEFKPERWLLADAKPHAAAANGHAPERAPDAKDDARLDLDAGAADTASGLYRPPPGAYVPFSAGPRSCLGRRFGQVEILAALAVVFSSASAELAIDEWASDEEVARMDARERQEVWGKARAETLEMLRLHLRSHLTLQLQDGKKVRLRFVKRGEERFG